ncbi:YdeI/OmpD-associated family protein [Cryobacterium sp. 10C3]|uniref:YdeI/OmpD-associated family protein n=1 Tax=Cryobacterium sp. 10C3 TaxID=3048577 RepID=UPI002AB5ABBB|nr:YdeI/OmpD-associated family protein [Cryobacterium sp. 10C3]MDY7558292.1 YdeI/OmpD-associated family protein [Cryobacterium sp. 10C3]
MDPARRGREPHGSRGPRRSSRRDRGARAQWDAFPPSARRGILEWIVQAKTPATRQKRIDETAVLAGRGERANQWKPKPPADPAPAPD